ncbi:hypothetical protein MMC25_003746 [Agyrium rufum]|nr:hypothetical protein [Agyrium rufum]
MNGTQHEGEKAPIGTRSPGSPSTEDRKNEAEEYPIEEKPSFLSRAWTKVGLDRPTVMLMFKGACPPLIATAMYQATPVADTFVTVGYLVAIMSILSFSILPRAKFAQTMILNVIGVCIGAAVALLAIYCSVKARQHTSPPQKGSQGPTPGTTVVPYNSSASAVSAVWLFFNILVANAFRASRPALQFPTIIYSIFANVACTYAPLFPTMSVGISFVKRLMEAFFTGFAIAFGVNLFIIPISARDVVLKSIPKYTAALQGALKAQTAYLQTLEKENVFAKSTDSSVPTEESQSAKKMKGVLGGLTALHGKMHADLTFAKRETAYGKLHAEDIDEIFELLRGIMLPMLGMGTIADIFERVAKRRGWDQRKPQTDEKTKEEITADDTRREQEVHEWNDIFKTVHGPFEAMGEALHDAFDHAMYALELQKKPKKKKESKGQPDNSDLESQPPKVEPGDPTFAKDLEVRLQAYHDRREETLRVWCKQKGIELPADAFTNTTHSHDQQIFIQNETPEQHLRNKRQLYLILYLEYLLHSAGVSVVNLVKYADVKVESGYMKRNHIIVPGKRRLQKWFWGVFKMEDSDADHTPDHAESGASNIVIGDTLQGKRKDPEHLPPKNKWEEIGDYVRNWSLVLASPSVAFGFRVACATMCVAITAYLEVSQRFYQTQRLVWAQIMVAIGMTVTTGSGVFGFMGRVGGTFIAMCLSFIIWYISGGRGATSGVLLLLFFAIAFELYFLLKIPRFTPVVIITMVTQVLILGYELEVRKIGVQLATSSGQPYYPIYELAPYRLATVAGGCFVGFIWLYFPYPFTARSQLRKDIGASLYLLANYYSCIQATTRMRLAGYKEDLEDPTALAFKLDKARSKILGKELAIIAGLRQHSSFVAFEFSLGGKFPQDIYDSIIDHVQNLTNYMALISYASKTLIQGEGSTDAIGNDSTKDASQQPQKPKKHSWINDLMHVVNSASKTSEEITSMLALLSASVTNGSPLPPYLKAPAPYQLSEKLEALDNNILSLSHIAEEGYASFAVSQVASSLINDDLGDLIADIKKLVGEVDFRWIPMEEGKTKQE